MFDTWKCHPFAVEAFFVNSLVLAYAVPRDELYRLIPQCLEPDTYQDVWGFVAVAMVQTRKLRPKGFPAFLGNDFLLTGYRVFVRYTSRSGKRLRGLYILKSETDSRKMEILGSLFIHYNYSATDLMMESDDRFISVSSENSRLQVKAQIQTNAALPPASPFCDWKEARRFAGPLPYTFTYNDRAEEVLIIEGVRQHWKPEPVEVIFAQSEFVQQLGFRQTILANAFIVRNIPYYWKKGRKEIWEA